MKELRDILEAARAAPADEAMALATIVGVSGSTYRREGARLLVSASGRLTGNISGGCLEGDVQVVAGEVMEAGTPRLMTYDLTADDDAVWGLGLGCNGKVEVFVEPLALARDFLDRLTRTLDEEHTLVAALVLGGAGAEAPGTRFYLSDAGSTSAGLGDGARAVKGGSPGSEDAGRIQRAMAAQRAEGRSGRRRMTTAAGDLDLFIEVIRPPVRLVVCGAGHDAVPVVAQAVGLGWRVVVVDRRETLLTSDRFPGPVGFVKVASFREAAAAMPVDDRTYVLVMTHNYMHDKDVLRGLASREELLPAYVGMLGPRPRTEKILKEIAGEGITLTPEARARIYGPVGLDVGAEGAEEIAVAAIGEILAVDRGRAAGFLRDRSAAIHAPTPA